MALKRKSEDQETPSPAKKQRVDSSRMISIIIDHGSGQKSLTVDENDIRDSHLLTNKIVSSRSWWTGRQSHAIHITDHHPHHFDLYYRWLMGRELSHRNAKLTESAQRIDASLLEGSKPEQDASCLDFMVKSWILGDYLQDASFKNAVMLTIMSLQINNASKIREDTIITVATKCDVSSGLYRWLVDILVCTHTTPSFKEQRMGWPKQLRCDVSESVIELADKSIFKKKLSLRADLPKYVESDSKRW